MEYYIEVHRIFGLYVEADNAEDARQLAFENAEAVNNGIADDEFAVIIKIDGNEVKQNENL